MSTRMKPCVACLSLPSLGILPSVIIILLVEVTLVHLSIPPSESHQAAESKLETAAPPTLKPTPQLIYSQIIRSNFNWKPLPYANFKLGNSIGKVDSGYDRPVYIPLIGEGEWNVTSNDPDVEIRRPSNSDLWKTKVIIACTVTATLEIVIVVMIIVYWKQIRWSLRKISCPCDPTPMSRSSHRHRRRRRRRHGQRSHSNPAISPQSDSDSSSGEPNHTRPPRPHDPGIEDVDDHTIQLYSPIHQTYSAGAVGSTVTGAAIAGTSRYSQTYSIVPTEDIDMMESPYAACSGGGDMQASVYPSTSRGTGSYMGQQQAYIISALRRVHDSDSSGDEEMSITIHSTGV